MPELGGYMSGSSTGTGWAIWFCHVCRWTGVLNTGEIHICKQKKP